MAALSIIGDPHGCINTLRALLEKLPESRIIIIDRGPGSYCCFRLVKDLGLEMVIGNHEYMFLQRNEGEHLLGLWMNNGGEEAMADICSQNPDKKSLQRSLAEMDEYFVSLPDKIEVEIGAKKLLISHAGIEEMTRKNLDECFHLPYDSQHGFLWTREQLAKIPDAIQIVGHTPTANAPQKDKDGNHYLDSGCFMKGRSGYGYLSALVFEDAHSPNVVVQENVDT